MKPKKPSDELEQYFLRAAQEMIPKMRKAALVTAILKGAPDPKLCLELGAAILLEKPLILLAQKGTWIPPRLRAVADEIVEVEDFNKPDAPKEQLQAAISRVVERLKEQ